MSITTTTKAKASPSFLLEQEHSVPATFNYWGTTDLPELLEIKKIFTGTSSKLRSLPATVNDIRAAGLDSFNITDHGFQVLRHSSSLLPPQSTSVSDFHDEQLMRSTYWPEIVSLLKSQLGVRAAVVMNTTVRDVSEVTEKEFNPGNPRANPNQSFQPFFVVHGDYTPAGARGHMRAVLPTFFAEIGSMESTSKAERDDFFKLREEIIATEEEGIKQSGVDDQWKWSGKHYHGPRWAMFSVWRPLETVRRDPLAVMDPKSLFAKKGTRPYVPFERIYKDRPGFEKGYKSENLLPIAPEEEGHNWYYISEQKPEEVYALKLFDSDAHLGGNQATECAAHSAFSLPRQEKENLRRSVEVRVMAVW